MMLLQGQRLLTRLGRRMRSALRPTGEVYVGDRVDEFRSIWRAAADVLGANFTELSDALWQVELDGRTTRILNHMVELDNAVTLEIAARKDLVYLLLRAEGLAVPDAVVFRLRELGRAYAFLARHPEGCVVKPAQGTSSGLGVTTHVKTRHEVRSAAILASLYGSELIIEPVIAGESVRMLVLHGKTIHAVRRLGVRLTGDGESSVAQLIAAHNRGGGSPPLAVDRDCEATLPSQGLTLDAVPGRDRVFLVKSARNRRGRRAELRTVYDDDITDIICDDLRETAERAARALRCELAGVDVITTDVTRPLRESGGFINEVNTTPGLHHHYDSAREAYPKPAVTVLRALLGCGPGGPPRSG